MDDDEAYAARLMAILTNPHPTPVDPPDHYGSTTDGIDRYDGFGSEVVVTSSRVVPSEHGNEIEVGFVLHGDLPAGVPAHGSVRVPVDQEWRGLSGFEDPATYAPRVAAQVFSAAGVLVQRHRDRGADAAPAPPPREEQWRMLLDELTRYGEVSVVAPGRIELREPDGTTRFTVLITAEQWEQTWGRHADGSVGEDLEELLASADDDETYVVSYRGDLHTSTRAELPPVRGRAWERHASAVRDAPRNDPGWSAEPV